jgi:nitrate/nitrite-specific signal transduction histidine kinase
MVVSPRIIEWMLSSARKIQHRVVQWRLLIMLCVASTILFFELIEHPDFLYDDSLYFFKEIAAYFGLIIIIMIMLELNIKANIIKNQTIKILDARHYLSMQLTAAKDWNEVVARVLQYPSTFQPVSAASLMIYHPATDNFTTEQSWIAPNMDINIPTMSISRDLCCANDLRKLTPNIHLVKPGELGTSQDKELLTYHIPLDFGNIQTGILNIHLAKNRPLDEENLQLLSNTAEVMTIGLNAAKQRLQQRTIAIANAATNERLEIARDLHDTLGQNLGYMHLKLDRILSNDQSEFTGGIHKELQGLRDIANESYELVRNTLIILHDQSNHRISDLFSAHAELIAKRTGMKIHISEDGQPHSLPPDYLKQLLFAYKESLANIEKHSGAREVNVNLSWSDTRLKVDIHDNGSGFERDTGPQQGHYGLNIIYDRINSIGGEVEIQSIPDHGTDVIFQLPLSMPNNSFSKETGTV